MKSRYLIDVTFIFGMVLLTAVFTGCAPSTRTNGGKTTGVNTDPIITILAPDIESLYLSWHELDQAYKDFKFLERGFLFDPDDRQLAYIQKAALYIQDASVRIHHRWEQLSVLHYIRREMMRDYLTLNIKELKTVIKEMKYDEKFLIIYKTFITHEPVTDELDRTLTQIKKNMDLLNQILEKILPLTNPAGMPMAL